MSWQGAGIQSHTFTYYSVSHTNANMVIAKYNTTRTYLSTEPSAPQRTSTTHHQTRSLQRYFSCQPLYIILHQCCLDHYRQVGSVREDQNHFLLHTQYQHTLPEPLAHIHPTPKLLNLIRATASVGYSVTKSTR
jgi:hypothetical protein